MIDPQGVRRRMNRHFKKILGVFEELINEILGSDSIFKKDDVLDMCLKINKNNPHKLSQLQIKMLFLVGKLFQVMCYLTPFNHSPNIKKPI
ncbi:putative geraniol 8-hydroxylase [Helianthus anomalus]